MSKIDDIMARLDYYPVLPTDRRDPTEEDLQQFEEDLGGKLPSDYRTFLAHYGCTGLGKGARFVIRDPNPWGSSAALDQFFGFSTNKSQDIVHQTKETYAGRIPNEVIPIGSDAGGNLILLGFDGAVTDQVFFWDHEHRELNEDRIDQLIAEVEAKGVDTSQLDEHAILWQWEQLYPDRLTKPPGYGNIYAVAESFIEFLDSLQPDPAYA